MTVHAGAHRWRSFRPRHFSRTWPIGVLWAVWAVLAAAAYGKSIRNALRLMVDPAPGQLVHDSHGTAVTGAAADALRVHQTFVGSWLEMLCAAAAIALATFNQLQRREFGLQGTARTRYVVGRGAGAGAAYLFILAAAAAVTNEMLAHIGVAARSYPGAADAAHDPALAVALLLSSLSAGIGEEVCCSPCRSRWPAGPAGRRRSRSPWWSCCGGRSTPTTDGVLCSCCCGFPPAARYRAAGSIWPLIAAHALYDALLFSSDAWLRHAALMTAATLTLTVAGAVVATIGCSRYLIDWRAERLAARAAA